MKNSFLKLAQNLDNNGKYKDADKLDDFIKLSQQFEAPFFARPTIQTRDTTTLPEMFNRMPGYQLTGGYLPQIYSGPGMNALDKVQAGQFQLQVPRGAMGLYETLQGDPEFAAQYMSALGYQIGAMQTGATLAKFTNVINYINQNVLREFSNESERTRVWITQIDPVVIPFLAEVLKSEVNLDAISQVVSTLQRNYSQIPALFNTVQRAVDSAMTDLFTTRNIRTIQKYNQLNDMPVLSPFMNSYRADQNVPTAAELQAGLGTTTRTFV